MPLPLIYLGYCSASATAGWLLKKWGESRSRKSMETARDYLSDADSAERRIEDARVSMLARCRQLLVGVQHELEKYRPLVLPYLDDIQTLREIHPPPEWANEPSQLPSFYFDYSVEIDAKTGTVKPDTEDRTYLVPANYWLNHSNHPGYGVAYIGLGMAKQGMEMANKAALYRDQARNHRAEVQASEKSLIAAFNADEETLRNEVTRLSLWLRKTYEPAYLVSMSMPGVAWAALSSDAQAALEHHYYFVVRLDYLCHLKAFGVFGEKST